MRDERNKISPSNVHPEYCRYTEDYGGLQTYNSLPVFWIGSDQAGGSDNKERIGSGQYRVDAKKVNEHGNGKNRSAATDKSQGGANQDRSKVSNDFHEWLIYAKMLEERESNCDNNHTGDEVIGQLVN